MNSKMIVPIFKKLYLPDLNAKYGIRFYLGVQQFKMTNNVSAKGTTITFC